LEIARRHHLAVIEDAAQSFGAAYRGQPVGALGDIGAISFFPSKNLGALGDAGLVVTNDPSLAEKVRRLRNHGMHPKYMHATVGGNFRLDALQAALLAVKLPHLAQYTAHRRRNAAAYTQALAGIASGDAITISLPVSHPDRTHIANQYTIRVRRGPAWRNPESPRDALRNRLAESGISSEIYYPLPLHAQECFRRFGPHPALPVAEQAAREVLSLPVFPELTAEEAAAVAAEIVAFASEQNG
jgi:dTDP-4-amino-4,6-dideoxygalactose transaminase